MKIIMNQKETEAMLGLVNAVRVGAGDEAMTMDTLQGHLISNTGKAVRTAVDPVTKDVTIKVDSELSAESLSLYGDLFGDVIKLTIKFEDRFIEHMKKWLE